MGGLLVIGIISVFILAVIMIFFMIQSKEENDKSENRRELFNEVLNSYNEIYNTVGIPQNCDIVKLKSTSASSDINIHTGEFYIWISKSIISLFPCKPILFNFDNYDLRECDVKKIMIENIEYFNFRGETYRETKISGGDGGGTSLTGAIVGGIIAGGTGAIIGSRKKNNPVKSELLTHDDRDCYINIFNSDKGIYSLFFEYKDYFVLKKIIPQKDYNYIVSNVNVLNSQRIEKQKSKSIANQIREFLQLKEEGIITEEEFVKKKNELLNK